IVARNVKKIIASDQDEREDQPGSASSTAWTHADRYSQERKNQAGGGQGNAVLEFDARVTPVGAMVGEKRRNRPLGLGKRVIFRCSFGVGDVNRDIAFAEGGHIVARRILRIVFVDTPRAEVELQLTGLGALYHLRILSNGDGGAGLPPR